MQKRLTRIGNSYGLIIERAVCRMIGVGLQTPLRISIHERSLVIEALDLPPGPSPDERELLGERYPAMVMGLVNRGELRDADFKRLHPTPHPVVRYALRSMGEDVPADEMVCRRRIREYARAIRAGRTPSEAVETALVEVPWPASAA